MDVPRLLALLNRIRATGHCFISGIPFPEAATISLPLPDAPHGIPLAIGVGGTVARITEGRARIVAVMQEAVEAYRATIASVPVSEPG